MRKIILGVAISLDGFIEDQNGAYDWCPPPSQSEMDEFLNGVDAIFFGRKSFDLAGPSAYPTKALYVFSNSLREVKGNNSHIIGGNIVKAVQEIKKAPGKNIWLYGGASLTTTFFNEGLVDELWLAVVPVVLGNGKPLFQNIKQRNYFKLLDASQKAGYLSVRYAKSKSE
jgi:dihydrofolate reductase